MASAAVRNINKTKQDESIRKYQETEQKTPKTIILLRKIIVVVRVVVIVVVVVDDVGVVGGALISLNLSKSNKS